MLVFDNFYTKKCFGEFGVCCSKLGIFIQFGEVYEQVLHDGNKLLVLILYWCYKLHYSKTL